MCIIEPIKLKSSRVGGNLSATSGHVVKVIFLSIHENKNLTCHERPDLLHKNATHSLFHLYDCLLTSIISLINNS